MKCITCALLIILLHSHDTIAQCDKSQAESVYKMVMSFSNISEKNDAVYCSWIDRWHSLTIPQKDGMIHALANADACLTGRARKVFIHYNGELVAEASPTFGIKVIK